MANFAPDPRDPNNANFQPVFGVLFVHDWLTNAANWARVQRVRVLDGGWENWLQIELSLQFDPAGPVGAPAALANAAQYTLRRERTDILRGIRARGRNSLQKLDIHLQSPAAGLAAPDIGIELKCHLQGETSDDFIGRLKVDMEKIAAGPIVGRPLTDLYAIGITNDIADLTKSFQAENAYAGAGNMVRTCPVPGTDLHIIWLRIRFS